MALRQRTPSVAKLGRWTKAAGQRCAPLLAALDEVTRPRVRQAVADEIFVRRRPILMVAEPQSLCWVSGRLVAHRDGATWAEEFAKLPALEQVAKDGGTGLANGLEQVNATRRRQGLAAIAEQDDHFHVLRDGRQALRGTASAARRALEKANRAQRGLKKKGNYGYRKTGRATVVAKLWRQAEQAFDAWGRQERAWQRVAAALTLFRSDGSLPTRAQAEAAVAAAVPDLAGSRWAKVRRALARPQLWTYLDRAQERLAALPVATELREAALQVEGARRRAESVAGHDPRSAAWRGVVLLAAVVLSRAGAAGAEALALVRGVLDGVGRASSLVEGINSVLRMQQARHRKLTPGLLDLKRLYWNCQPFRTGKRRRHSPYELLGVPLPPLPWWDLLKWSPEQLRKALSAPEQQSSAINSGGDGAHRSPVNNCPRKGLRREKVPNFAANDGTVSYTGDNANGQATYTISGTNTYVENQTYDISVTINDDDGGSVTVGSTAVVSDAQLTATNTAITAVEGFAFTGVVASFTDADPNAVTGDYSATIDWGDGNTSAGTIAANNNGGFDVSGTNTYAEEGSYPILVQIADTEGGEFAPGDSTACASSTAHVSIAGLLPDANNPALLDLYINDTNPGDTFLLSPAGSNGVAVSFIDGPSGTETFVSDFPPPNESINQIIILPQGGGDSIQITSGISQSIVIDSGASSNFLTINSSNSDTIGVTDSTVTIDGEQVSYGGISTVTVNGNIATVAIADLSGSLIATGNIGSGTITTIEAGGLLQAATIGGSAAGVQFGSVAGQVLAVPAVPTGSADVFQNSTIDTITATGQVQVEQISNISIGTNAGLLQAVEDASSGSGVLSNTTIGTNLGTVEAGSISGMTVVYNGNTIIAAGQGTTSNVSIGTNSGSFTAPEDSSDPNSGVMSNTTIGTNSGTVSTGSISGMSVSTNSGSITAAGQGTTSNVSIGSNSGLFTAPEDSNSGSGTMSNTSIGTNSGTVSTGSISGMSVSTNSGSITAAGQGTTSNVSIDSNSGSFTAPEDQRLRQRPDEQYDDRDQQWDGIDRQHLRDVGFDE